MESIYWMGKHTKFNVNEINIRVATGSWTGIINQQTLREKNIAFYLFAILNSLFHF